MKTDVHSSYLFNTLDFQKICLHYAIKPLWKPALTTCKLASCKCTKSLYKSLSKLVCKPCPGGGFKPVSNWFRICRYIHCSRVNALSWHKVHM